MTRPRGRDAEPPARIPPEGAQAGLFQVLWRQRILVLIPIVISLLLAGVYLLTETSRYISSARLSVSPRSSAIANDNGQLSNFLYAQSEKVVSREILALALAQPVPEDSGLQDMIGKQIRDLQTFKLSDESPLTTLKTFADVTVGKKDGALTVSYETPVREEAPVITNAIVRAYMKFQSQPKQSNIGDVLAAHRAEKTKTETELTEVNDQMLALEQQYGSLSNNAGDNLAFKQLALATQQLAAAHSETLRAKSDFEDAARLSMPDPRLIGSDPAPVTIVSAEDEGALRAEMMQLQTRLQDLKSHYLPDHPVVRALQHKLNQTAATYAEAVKRRYARCKATEDDLQVQFEKQQKRAIEVSAQADHHSHLKENADRLSRQVSMLETRISDIELQQSAGAVNIEFDNPADISEVRKSHPSKVRAVGLALVAGFLAGCCVAMLRDWVDDRLHSADEIRSSLGVALLGAIPRMAEGIGRDMAGQKSLLDPTSEVAEAFRSVRTAIHFGSPRDRSKTLLITSPSAGDGKSTAAANLAAVTAQGGKKVLLIDADLRHPSLNTIFNLKDSRLGLSSLLNGQGTWERAIQSSAISTLELLPCGPKPRNPSEMLNSPLFGELLEMLAEKYDQIIVDSPPVMGVTDSRIIAASCDHTILVLRADQSTRKLAKLARDGLANVGAQLLGVIVNDVSRRSEVLYEGAYRYPSTEPETPAPTIKIAPGSPTARTTELVIRGNREK